MGEPPPISLYFLMIEGALILAFKGPNQSCNGSGNGHGSLIMSLSRKSLVKNSCTSSAFLGPPKLV